MILENEHGHGEDLRRFIRLKLAAGNGEHDAIILNRVQEKSNGVFMWVVLVVEILNTEYRRGRMWAVERRLDEIPTELSHLFKDMLRRDRFEMEELLLCLQWILFSKRPLRPEEFYHAMVVGCNQVPPEPSYSEFVTNQSIARFVTSSSKGLAEITVSHVPTVQFIHESVQDFLLKDGGLNDPKRRRSQ